MIFITLPITVYWHKLESGKYLFFKSLDPEALDAERREKWISFWVKILNLDLDHHYSFQPGN